MATYRWILTLCFVLASLSFIQGEVLESLLWDPRNGLFEERCSGRDHDDNHARIFVNSNSMLNFVCPSLALVPRRSDKPVPSYALFENLHIVSKTEFDNCEVNSSNPESRRLMQCDQARSVNYLKYHTVVFRQWRTKDDGLRFNINQTYYFIATSDGTKSSLSSLKGGHCKTKNMRLAVTICGWDCSSCPNMCCQDKRPVASSPAPTTASTATRLTQTVATSTPVIATSPPEDNHVIHNETRGVVKQPGDPDNHVSLEQRSAGRRTGSESSSLVWVMFLGGGFLLGVVCTCVVLRVWQWRKTQKKSTSGYAPECKTRIDTSRLSPSFGIHKPPQQRNSLQRLISTSSSSSRGTDSL